ncbi:hypothetical protein C7212DRAFT_318315 [Tuber magnatum]|uniref:Uncharacterized protein n=1 Tax=Tuber magnatum TaxID=42249 RepID=A0A317SRP7_9PEZI|nr:hypothetical protein C7212DRAFT_318315 [Tuber magnatum]
MHISQKDSHFLYTDFHPHLLHTRYSTQSPVDYHTANNINEGSSPIGVEKKKAATHTKKANQGKRREKRAERKGKEKKCRKKERKKRK